MKDDEVADLFTPRHISRPGQNNESIRSLTILRGPRRRREAEQEKAEDSDREGPSHENHPVPPIRALFEAVNSP